MKVLLLFCALFGASTALELTKDTWDAQTAGKTVFVKFFAPWCGHCKRMKPDWDKLMAEFKDSKTALIADVDCTTEAGKPLCADVRGFPTIKHGDPNALEDYKGGRTYADLKKFAEENLGPVCGPNNLDLCPADKKKQITDFQAEPEAALKQKIEDGEKKIKDAEKAFEKSVEGLQKQYEEMSKKKDDTIAAIKDSGLSLMKSVLAAKKSGGSQEL